MEVPIELMPPVARKRIESLQLAMKRRCSLEDKMEKASLFEHFLRQIAGNIPFVIEKQIEDAEEWVFEQLKRDSDWVADTAQTLYDEALATREDAVRAQLCSAIGRDIPDDFALSAEEEAEAKFRADESAQSIAETFNAKLRFWIEAVKAEWAKEHGGSFVGLNRFTLMKLVRRKIEDYDEWKTIEIAATEFSTEWQAQTFSFWLANRGKAELEYYLAPRHASDPARDSEPICMEYAGRWLSESDASMFPAHPRCIHFVERTRVVGGRLPIVFAIGGIMYTTNELPEC